MLYTLLYHTRFSTPYSLKDKGEKTAVSREGLCPVARPLSPPGSDCNSAFRGACQPGRRMWGPTTGTPGHALSSYGTGVYWRPRIEQLGGSAFPSLVYLTRRAEVSDLRQLR